MQWSVQSGSQVQQESIKQVAGEPIHVDLWPASIEILEHENSLSRACYS